MWPAVTACRRIESFSSCSPFETSFCQAIVLALFAVCSPSPPVALQCSSRHSTGCKNPETICTFITQISVGMKSKLSGGLLMVVELTINVACQPKPPNYPTGAIELKYYAPGTWAVTVSVDSACCDSSGNKFDLYYPTNLGANGFLHPILTWGNGTFASPGQYEYFLRHMASWGFLVVATEDFSTGLGQTILDGAKFMIHANGDPTSIFYHKLNVNQIGSFGHSQGASGAISALTMSAGSIKTVVPLELPAQM